MDLRKRADLLLKKHADVRVNKSHRELIRDVVQGREAIVSSNGALARWTPPPSTGRSPADTYIVRDRTTERTVDWDSPSSHPMAKATFDALVLDCLKVLEKKQAIYCKDRSLGADVSYALPVRIVTDSALTSLFAYHMFRPVPDDIRKSAFHAKDFLLLALPYDKPDPGRYKGKLRAAEGRTSDIAIATDFTDMIGIVYGSSYCGSVKKLMFTVMNYILPPKGVLPLHCAANEGRREDIALFLGLSGTGKTSLSTEPDRALLGDDEHGWSAKGVANFENGCYAKLIGLDRTKEPEIFDAITHKDDWLRHGAITENAMVYPDGSFDFHDNRFAENSRGSYPLRYLANVKKSSTGRHPKTIIFLTADANGVLPPISRLGEKQAMLWFLMGYTSKLEGTETGIIGPKTTFSRFFGEPFMPRAPGVYDRMLGEKMKRHGIKVYLINTGWSGGPHGVGKRIDIRLTRRMVKAAISGSIEKAKFEENPLFHILVPKTCPGVPAAILNPKNTWKDKAAYDERALRLAKEFSEYFDKAFGGKGIDKAIERECPGK